VLSRKKARNIATAVDDMGVDLHKKWGPWTKYKQNANLGNSYCSYKNLHQANTVAVRI